MNSLFVKLSPFQKAEFGLMLILAFSMPFYWYVTQILEVALITCSLLKVIFQQKLHLNELQLRWKWVYIIFMLTWAATLYGMIYTENTSEGWGAVSKKLGFMLFPLVFLLSDMSYLNKDRIRAIFYSLVIGILVFFIPNLIWAAIDVIFNGYDTSRFFDQDLMKLYYVHHSYLSMYVALAFAFCYVEFFNHKETKVRAFSIIALILLFVFIILCNSRAGILTIFIEIVILLVWTVFVKKEKKIGITSLAVILILVGGMMKFYPDSFARVTETIKNITSSYNDRRLVQFAGYKQVINDNWMFGVGTGDKYDELVKSYESYRNKIVSSIKPVQGVDKQTFEHNRDILLQEILSLTERENDCNWHLPNEVADNHIMTNAEARYCTPESVNKIYVGYIFTTDAITNTLDTHNQYFEELVSLGLVALILLLSYFIIPVFIMIKNKRYSIIYLIFIMIISFNALFESIFEMQYGIIFFNFFNMLLFSCLIMNTDSKNKVLKNEK